MTLNSEWLFWGLQDPEYTDSVLPDREEQYAIPPLHRSSGSFCTTSEP